MAKSDPQTSGSEPGGIADESASAVGEATGSPAPLSEDEKWGFTDKKSGMPSETKAGIAIVLVLIGAFGFIAYTKYGQGLKDKTLAAIKGKAPDETTEVEPEDTAPPAPQENPPSAFGPDENSSGRVALNEDEIFGDQGEPVSPTESVGADDAWGSVADSQPTAPASTAPASAATPAGSEADPFSGFESSQPAATPAVQTRVTEMQQDSVGGFGDSDPFGDPGTATADLGQPAPAAQPSAPAGDFDPWGDNAEPSVAASEPAAFQPQGGTPMEQEPVPQPAAASDPFADSFADPEPKPAPAATVAQQPDPRIDTAPVQPKDAGFDFDDSAVFGDDPMPASESSKAPVAFAEPAPRERTPVQPTQPVRSDAFDDPGIDFNDGFDAAPVRRDVVAQPAKPPERFDRGFVDRQPIDRIDRTVSRPVEPSEMERYTVRQSDTYWSISKKVYGTSRYYRALAKYNERIITDPRRMRPGTQLDVPPMRELERLYPKMFPRVRTVSATRIAGEGSGLYLDTKGNPVYRVGSNDTLSRIAYRHLGRASSWADIYKLNRDQLASPEAVRPGMILKMPLNASQVVTREAPMRR